MNLITIHVYNDLQLATLAKMKLEAEGISAYIPSSGMIGITGLVNALGGVRLQVAEEFSEKAANIIKEFNQITGFED